MKVSIQPRLFALASIVLIATGASTSWANYCSDLAGSIRQLDGQIGGANARITQLAMENNAENTDLEKQLRPLWASWSHTVHNNDETAGLLADSLSAVQQAVVLAEETMSASLAIDKVFEKLKKNVVINPNQSLAEQIVLFKKAARLSKAASEQIEQFAKAIRRLETSVSSWQKVENEILLNFIDGKQSLLAGTLARLREMSAKLEGRIKAHEQAREADRQKAETLASQITAAEQRMTNRQSEIGSLQQALPGWANQRSSQSDTYNRQCIRPIIRDECCHGRCC